MIVMMRPVVLAAFLLIAAPVAGGAEDPCKKMPPGPERTDCYLALSRFYRDQGDLAAMEAQAIADAAWYRALTTGTEPPWVPRSAVRSRRR